MDLLWRWIEIVPIRDAILEEEPSFLDNMLSQANRVLDDDGETNARD